MVVEHPNLARSTTTNRLALARRATRLTSWGRLAGRGRLACWGGLVGDGLVGGWDRGRGMPGGACRLGRGPVAVFSTHSQGLELRDRHEPGLALRHGDSPGLAEDRPGHDPVCGSSHDVSGAFLFREFRVDVAAGG